MQRLKISMFMSVGMLSKHWLKNGEKNRPRADPTSQNSVACTCIIAPVSIAYMPAVSMSDNHAVILDSGLSLMDMNGFVQAGMVQGCYVSTINFMSSMSTSMSTVSMQFNVQSL